MPEVEFEWKIPKWSNAIERDRARTYFQAYAAACGLHFAEKAMKELHAGQTKTWTDFKVPEEAIGCGFHEAVRGVLSHHVVIRDGKIANYHPYPPTPWNANPRDIYGTPGLMKTRCRIRRSLRRTGRTTSKASTSCARYAASIRVCHAAFTCIWENGKVLETVHSPMFGESANVHDHERNTKEFQERVRRIDGLLEELESAADPASRTQVRELVQNV